MSKEEKQSKKDRPVHLFEVPERLADETNVKEVGLITLTADEELMCFKRASGNNAKLATELAKASLYEVDGKKLSAGDGSVDSFWKDMDPRLRQLVLTAYTEIHAAKEDDVASFLTSRKLRAG